MGILIIWKSEAGTDIKTFDIAINSRGSGIPPYEGPEYEKYVNGEWNSKRYKIQNYKSRWYETRNCI